MKTKTNLDRIEQFEVDWNKAELDATTQFVVSLTSVHVTRSVALEGAVGGAVDPLHRRKEDWRFNQPAYSVAFSLVVIFDL